jgi:hypothetical protein
MESNNQLSQDYEKFIGPLSQFPYQYYIDYSDEDQNGRYTCSLRLSNPNLDEGKPSDPRCNVGLCLYPNGIFGKDLVRVSCKGHYDYEVKSQTLTITINQVSVWEFYGKYETPEGRDQGKVMEKVLSENFKQVVIKNFNWFTRTISLKRPSSIPDGDLENYSSYVEKECQISFDDGVTPNSNIVTIKNKIERLKKGPVTRLPHDYVYEMRSKDTTNLICLHPDGSFDFKDSDYSWDRDGCYNWDSTLTSRGSWIYDSDNRTIKLKFFNFSYSENGKLLDFYSSCKDPEDVVTTNFTFEGETIQVIGTKWNYGKLLGLDGVQTFKLKRSGEN